MLGKIVKSIFDTSNSQVASTKTEEMHIKASMYDNMQQNGTPFFKPTTHPNPQPTKKK